MTVRDLYRVLTLSQKVQFYDEQCNEYDSLCGIEEYEVLYIKDWQAGTYEPNALEQYNPFKSYLRLSIVIAPPKAKEIKVCSKCGDRAERLEIHKDGRIDMMIWCKCKKVKDTMNLRDENNFFRVNELADAWNRLDGLWNERN